MLSAGGGGAKEEGVFLLHADDSREEILNGAVLDAGDMRAEVFFSDFPPGADSTVDIYLTEAPTIFEQMDGAVRSGDAEGTRRAAHSLKSASGNLRAGRLSDLLQAMEVLGKEGDVEGAQVAFPELLAEFESVMTYLRSLR